MKKLIQIMFFSVLLLSAAILYTGCKKVLDDKAPLSTYTAQLLFSDSSVAVQYLNTIYASNQPGWAGNGGSLSAIGSAGIGNLTEENYSSNPFTLGTVTTTTVGDIGTSNTNSNNYAKIRSINDFIANLPASPLPAAMKKRFFAQAMFWRAYRYFDLVRLYGGVPLVLSPLDVVGDDAKLAAQIPRSTTTATYTQIVADLDSAIKYLPPNWPGVDYGRITKGAAQAFKGRVLLTWASPEFNTTGDAARWQAAYQASTDAIATLTASGYGLYSKWDVTMWTTEPSASTSTQILTPANPEAVMVTAYNNLTDDNTRNSNTYSLSCQPKSLGGSGSNAPTWDEVAAFPMADGKNPHDPTGKYFPWDSVRYYNNRDPRFAQTIAYNGAIWPLQGNANYRVWTYYYYNKANASSTATTEASGASSTGFYLRKAVDPNLSLTNLPYSGIDWQEIRYAEVLLNQAEAAAMIGNSTVAYNDLVLIRKRAGLQAGSDNMYGLKTGLTGVDLAKAVLYERQIELAYEGKRFWDLRRWKLLESVMNASIKQRKGVTFLLAPNNTGTDYISGTRDNLANTGGLDAIYTTYFSYAPMIVSNSSSVLGELKNLDTAPIAYQSGVYFFGIPLATMQSNPNITQNNTWGGPFDPTK